jgi:transposase
MSVYVGIDVHRKRSQVAVVTGDGTVELNKNVVNGSEPMLRLIGDLPPGTPVAFEAAFGWGWLAQLLEDYGFEAHLVHPLRCKAIASARLKNDKVDAAILAQLLRADLLPEAWIAPAAVRQLRALLRHRAGLVRLGTQQQNRIHAVVADFGHDRSGSYLSGPGRGWLAGLDLPPVSREVVTDCLAVIDGLAPVIDRIDGELRQYAKADPRVKTLTTLPGVGQFTALVMLAEIGDISRFGSARKLASWAGLTPTVRGSDLTVRHGHISKMVCAGGMVPLRRPEVCDGGGWRIGFAQGSADVRLCRYRDGRELAWPDLSGGSGEPARVAAPVRRRAGRGVRGRGVHRVALRGGGTAAGRDHCSPGRARRDGGPAGPQAPRQDGLG